MTDRLTRWVDELIAAKPRVNVTERVLRDGHDQWLRSAELHRPYYSEDSEYQWIGPEWGPFELYCSDRWEFTERRSHALYTAEGVSSMRAWAAVGAQGLLTTEPPRPISRPTRLRVNGDLRDGGHAERWRFSMVTL
jgi:hypothetical protein